ncbi:alkaline phosphatase [Histoplasma capsulatum G186AR]|uniref:Alkaline phosphatase n=1 Tax=Ajellomyces capsulatus (strain G186AR / H82 / ATCC MYA-2454 / RMSCC 2432) TaxID=447093 RepID=C0NFL2_AJECG|nr:alkaline phosphatase [Histoplasma capsulatum G186AR]EEH10033.1 alkaline phosphatase [Histoplasma capsulatum G186AR]
MAFLKVALAGLWLSSIASASFSSNLNYRSPSHNHPDLGIAINKVQKRNVQSSPFKPEELHFTHNVASGDPYPHSVILWTRISPTKESSGSNVTVSGTAPLYDHDNDKYVAVSTAPVCVEYKVAKDDKMRRVVTDGEVWTSSDVDYTVKVYMYSPIEILSAHHTLTCCDKVCDSKNSSPIGRTKTTPRKFDRVRKDINLSVFSCSNYPQGFFNAYGNAARKDTADYVVHLGDYIYEYKEDIKIPKPDLICYKGGYGWGWSMDRIPQPSDHNVKTLLDYRMRYASYRTDADLVYSHQYFPWITVWDDHEVEDNIWKAGSSKMNNTEESFIKAGGISIDQSKANAVRAHFEWMPIRQVDMDDNLRIWRNFEIGDLFSLIMLDTRVYDRSITDVTWNREYLDEIRDEQSRSLLGPRQETWFYRQLRESAKRRTKWRIVGQQVLISDISYADSKPDTPYNADAWDGYRANKNRTLATILNNKIDNTIFLAGDTHASYVSDLVYTGHGEYDSKSGSGAIGVEFGGSGVTSPGPVGQNGTLAKGAEQSKTFVKNSTPLQWQDSYYRGYYELKINHERVIADFFGVPDIRTRNGKEIKLATFEVLDGANKLTRNEKGEPVVGQAVGGALKHGEVHPDAAVIVDTMKKEN